MAGSPSLPETICEAVKNFLFNNVLMKELVVLSDTDDRAGKNNVSIALVSSHLKFKDFRYVNRPVRFCTIKLHRIHFNVGYLEAIRSYIGPKRDQSGPR